MAKAWDWLIAPIHTGADAEKILMELRKGWYAFGGLMAVVGFFLRYAANGSYEFLGDVAICFLGGYFLPRSKSRALAVFLLLYALVVAGITVATQLGMYEGAGKNIVLSALIAIVGYRGLKATSTYQRGLGTETSWRNVGILLGACAVAAIAAFGGSVGLVVVRELSGRAPLPDEALGTVFFTVAIILWATCFVALRKRYPLVTRRMEPLMLSGAHRDHIRNEPA